MYELKLEKENWMLGQEDGYTMKGWRMYELKVEKGNSMLGQEDGWKMKGGRMYELKVEKSELDIRTGRWMV